MLVNILSFKKLLNDWIDWFETISQNEIFNISKIYIRSHFLKIISVNSKNNSSFLAYFWLMNLCVSMTWLNRNNWRLDNIKEKLLYI